MAHYDIQPIQSSRAVVNGASPHIPKSYSMDFLRNDAVGKSKKRLKYPTVNILYERGSLSYSRFGYPMECFQRSSLSDRVHFVIRSA